MYGEILTIVLCICFIDCNYDSPAVPMEVIAGSIPPLTNYKTELELFDEKFHSDMSNLDFSKTHNVDFTQEFEGLDEPVIEIENYRRQLSFVSNQSLVLRKQALISIRQTIYHCRYKIQKLDQKRRRYRNNADYKAGYMYAKIRQLRVRMLNMLAFAKKYPAKSWKYLGMLRLYQRFLYLHHDILSYSEMYFNMENENKVIRDAANMEV